MPRHTQRSRSDEERTELPIERGFPIERINEIAAKESRAKQWYRPIYTMHKWWARRLGCLFRSICLYSLSNEDEGIDVFEVGETNSGLDSFADSEDRIAKLIGDVAPGDPESLWELYPEDVRVENALVLDCHVLRIEVPQVGRIDGVHSVDPPFEVLGTNAEITQLRATAVRFGNADLGFAVE